MPSGLDGNPDPISTPARQAVLASVAAKLDLAATANVTLVAVDGIDGAGKTTFADEVGAELTARDRVVIRATIDSFHNPRAVRWQQGRSSPLGFYRDSHNLAALKQCLLDPLTGGGDAEFRRAAFDEPSDQRVDAPLERAPAGAILLFDGIFLQRPELRAYWNVSLFLDGERRVAEERTTRALANCPSAGPAAVWHLAWWWCVLDRYVSGQRLYFAECDPKARADLVIDNNDLAAPSITADRLIP